VERYAGILEQWGRDAVEGDKDGDASSHSFALLEAPVGLALSDSEKAEALANRHGAQFQPVNDPTHTTVFEMVHE
jgi:hypothetical protein